MSAAIVFRATVDGVSTVDVSLCPVQPNGKEEPIGPLDPSGRIAITWPHCAEGGDEDLPFAQAFGAVFGIVGAIKITVEVDVDGKP